MARLFYNILEDMDIAEEEMYFGDGKAKARISAVTIIQWRKKDYWQSIE